MMKREEIRRAMVAIVVLISAAVAVVARDVASEGNMSGAGFIRINVSAVGGISGYSQNFSKAVPGVETFNFEPKYSYGASVSAEFAMRGRFALGTSLTFTSNHNTYSMSVVDLQSGTYTRLNCNNRYYDVTIPVYIAYRYPLGSKVNVMSQAGWYFMKGLGGHSTYTSLSESLDSLDPTPSVSQTVEHKYYDDPQPIICGIKSFDHGLYLGAGVEICRHVTLLLTGRIGARNVAVNNGSLDCRIHNLSVDARLGYTF